MGWGVSGCGFFVDCVVVSGVVVEGAGAGVDLGWGVLVDLTGVAAGVLGFFVVSSCSFSSVSCVSSRVRFGVFVLAEGVLNSVVGAATVLEGVGRGVEAESSVEGVDLVESLIKGVLGALAGVVVGVAVGVLVGVAYGANDKKGEKEI